MSLKKRAVSSLKWQVGLSIIQRIIGFGVTIVLARLLDPSTFGIFSFVIVICGAFELFKSLGIDSALIRRSSDFEKAANTAFLIIPFLGIMLYVILHISAPYVAGFLNCRDLVPVIRIHGITFVIASFAKVPAVALERDLKYKYISLADFCGSSAYSVSAVIFAFLNFGVWSLIYAYVLRMFIYAVIVWSAAKWKPLFQFDKKLAIEMFDFGKFIFLTSVLMFLRNWLDTLLVGKLLGTAILGYYGVAFSLSNIGTEFVGSKLNKIMYPVFSKLRDNEDNLKNAFLNVFRYVLIFALPLGVGTFILGPDFLRIVYGEKWVNSIPLLKILIFTGIFNLIVLPIDSLFMAIGKPKLNLITASIQVAFFFGLIVPASKMYGITGICVIVSFAAFTKMLFDIYFAKKSLNLKFSDLFSSIKTALLPTLAMLGSIVLSRIYLDYLLINSVFDFAIMAGTAILFYGGSIYFVNRQVFEEIKGMIKI